MILFNKALSQHGPMFLLIVLMLFNS